MLLLLFAFWHFTQLRKDLNTAIVLENSLDVKLFLSIDLEVLIPEYELM